MLKMKGVTINNLTKYSTITSILRFSSGENYYFFTSLLIVYLLTDDISYNHTGSHFLSFLPFTYSVRSLSLFTYIYAFYDKKYGMK